MNSRQLHVLSLRQTDVQGAVHRLCDDEKTYEFCLREFLQDETMSNLQKSLNEMDWDEAFTAAHALKGLAGNMGFVPLMHSVGQMVALIRGGRVKEIDESLEHVGSCYRDIVDAICQYFACEGEAEKGNCHERQ